MSQRAVNQMMLANHNRHYDKLDCRLMTQPCHIATHAGSCGSNWEQFSQVIANKAMGPLLPGSAPIASNARGYPMNSTAKVQAGGFPAQWDPKLGIHVT